MNIFKDIVDWSLSDFASFFGGLIILIYISFEAFKKATEQTRWAQERKKEKEKIKREAAHKQYKEFTDEFVKEFVPPLIARFEQSDKEIIEKLNKLNNSSNDMLRKQMTDIYYKYLPFKKILQYDKKCFIKLYHDYGAQGGNSYIEELKKELDTWEVVLTEEDLHW